MRTGVCGRGGGRYDRRRISGVGRRGVRAVLAWLARRATLLLAAGVFAGLLLPGAAALLRPLLTPAVWGLLLLALLRIDWADVVRHARRPGPAAAIVVWLLVVSPMLMAPVVAALDPAPGLATALVLVAAVPPIISAPALAVILGLDGALALLVMVAAILAAPLVLPTTGVALLALELELGVADLMLHLGIFIGSAAAVAAVVRHGFGRRRLATAATGIDVAAVALLLVFAIAIMDGVTGRLAADPAWVLTVAGTAIIVHLALQLAGGLAFAWLDRRRAVTAAFVSGNRNMAVVLAVLPAGVHEDVFLYFAMAQIPIYVLPALLAPVYRRLVAAQSG